jgi:hypothetical protein
MLMYTEKQLEESYTIFVFGLVEIRNKQNVPIDIPTLEDFRHIYEEGWNQILEDEWYFDGGEDGSGSYH